MSKPMTRSKPAAAAGAHHADDAAGRPRQDRVLALEGARVGEAAVRLHEEQPHARHLGRDLLDVAAQDRRQIGIDDRGVAAADELHQRADLVRDRDLGEADRARELAPTAASCVRVAVAVHEDDGDDAIALVDTPAAGRLPRCASSSGEHDLAVRADALVDLDHRSYSSSGSTMWRSNRRGRFW